MSKLLRTSSKLRRQGSTPEAKSDVAQIETEYYAMNRVVNREPNGMLERSLSARTLNTSAVKRKDFLRQAFAICEDHPLQRPFGMVRSKSNRSFRRVQGLPDKSSELETSESKASFRTRSFKDRQDSLTSFGSIHTTDSTASLLRKTGLLDSASSTDFDNSIRADSSLRASSRADNSFRTVDSISLRHKQLKPIGSDDVSSFWGSNPDLTSAMHQSDDLSVFSSNTLMTEVESLSDDNNYSSDNDDECQFVGATVLPTTS